MTLIIIGIGLFIIVMNHVYGGENWLSFIGDFSWLDSEGMDMVIIIFMICFLFILKHFGGGKN
ncbi:hypothetical protein KAJ27_11770 [bacterium]|nr:hypothetical protein [bacterium]